MLDEHRELIEWLTLLLNPNEPLPAGRPPILDGARCSLMDSRRVTVKCADGAEYIFIVMALGWTKEKLPERLASPEYAREKEDALRKVEAWASETHAGHEGSFEACHRVVCQKVREWITLFGGASVPPGTDPDAIH